MLIRCIVSRTQNQPPLTRKKRTLVRIPRKMLTANTTFSLPFLLILPPLPLLSSSSHSSSSLLLPLRLLLILPLLHLLLPLLLFLLPLPLLLLLLCLLFFSSLFFLCRNSYVNWNNTHGLKSEITVVERCSYKYAKLLKKIIEVATADIRMLRTEACTPLTPLHVAVCSHSFETWATK